MGGQSPGDGDGGGGRPATGDAQSPATVGAASPAAGVKRREAGSVPRDDGSVGADAAAEDGADEAGRRKRAKAGPGSRGVANLTPEQLAKKRANDREAQRAIRERTKNQIETLERRIRELTSLKPYQELQAVVRAKEAVERENADIKRQLATVVGLLNPIIGADRNAPGASPAPAYAPPTAPPAAPPVPTSVPYHASPTPTGSASPAGTIETPHGWAHGDAPSVGTPGELSTVQHLQQQRHRIRHDLEMGPERLELGFLLQHGQGQHLSRLQGGIHGPQDTPQYQHVPMKHDWTAVTKNEALGSRHSPLAGTSGPLPGYDGQSPGAVGATGAHHHHPHKSGAPGEHGAESPPRYAMPIRHGSPTCPLDSLLLDFMSERRQRAAEGLPMAQVIGPQYPSVSSLLNPANSAYSHPLSKVFTDILATFPDISMLPERVAVLYAMFLLMRWQIAPTRQNYERVPAWLRPTASQLSHPHPAWVDHVPFPAMREKLARDYNPHEYLFDNFFIPFTTTLCLSWPYDETDTLLLVPDSDEVVINPVFERHLRNLDNWTLGDRFARAFPSLADTYNVESRSRHGSAGGGASSSSAASSVSR
ncbi:hypothetical protein JDV02_006432 [Purpureocillium takamizusanense]|uniref:BZIP transcription factor n=1 Tax=Purpureocillium takamizusanense TaxID=2060973 RepID=A0A9Q8QJI4_9HYPO|nr:uncharacterized protein JDV02_006432 [Purpureocillium takamizusanense]UNI20336.1 hypothetical protein JDV02_006432 [Purpureocillium takamizusanense]